MAIGAVLATLRADLAGAAMSDAQHQRHHPAHDNFLRNCGPSQLPEDSVGSCAKMLICQCRCALGSSTWQIAAFDLSLYAGRLGLGCIAKATPVRLYPRSPR